MQNPSSKETLYNRGLCYYESENYAAAIGDFSACLAIDSNFKDANWMLASALQQSGETAKANTIYRMLNTKYGGYKDSEKRVLYYRLSVLISDNWYFMVAIFFMVILLITIVAKTVLAKRGHN